MPSPARVAARYQARTASRDEMQVGDRIELNTRRNGWVEATIAEVNHNYRARKYPYTIRSVTDDGQDYHGKRSNIRYDDPANARGMRYKGRSKTKKVIQDSLTRRDDRDQRKQDRADAGHASLESWKLQPGDVISYQYRNGTKRETVAGVNYRTGKVGIERHSAPEKARRLEERDRNELVNELMGGNRRRTRNTDVRWLPATGIVQVVSRA